jgi:hypothetical protein
MRYCIREATSSDLDRVAALIVDNAGEWSGSAATNAAERLIKVWRLSARVWIAVDECGVPAALFASGPIPDEFSVGHFWMLVFDSFDDSDRDLRLVARLVLDELLQDFDQLENVIDGRKTTEIALLRSLGFASEPAAGPGGSQQKAYRVWLSGGRRSSRPAH